MASEPKQFQPNFGRQMAYAGSLLAVIIAAYLLTTLFMGPAEQKPEPVQISKQATAPTKANPTPWYQQQSPPPSMITTPDLPLFPDVEDQQDTRAYEEALPKETYVP
ncbi:MAG: hypothetical protein ISR53_09340, partial [Rhodospirillales bacterium]|nr:hypothetical protein [Rhodospirillales bacterium]